MFRGQIRVISESGCSMMTRAYLHAERYSEVDLRFSFNNIDYSTMALVMSVGPGKGVELEFSFDDLETEASFLALIREVKASPPPEPE